MIVRTALTALLLAAAVLASAQTGPNAFRAPIVTTPLGGGLYQLSAGSNAVLAVGKDEAVLVDSLFYNPDKLAEAVRAITKLPVRTLILTHAHRDHTGGAATFAAMGAKVIATPIAAYRIERPSTNMRGEVDPAIDKAGWPTRLIGKDTTLTLASRPVRFIPVEPSHTDGDAMVFLPKDNVLILSDLHHSHEYPVYDAQSGCKCGSYEANLRVYDRALAMSDAKTKIIAGHGGVTNRAELTTYVAMLRDVREQVRSLIKQGRTKQQVIDAKLLAANPAIQPGGPDNRDAFIGTLYTALTTGYGI